MKGLNYWAIGLAAITVVGMTGCGAKKEAEVNMAPMKQEAAKTATNATNTMKAAGGAAMGSAALLGVVKEAKTAIAAGDFAKAGEAFAKFEDSWKLVENGIKAKTPKAYNTIEESIDGMKAAIKSKDTAKAKAALTTLETALAVVK